METLDTTNLQATSINLEGHDAYMVNGVPDYDQMFALMQAEAELVEGYSQKVSIDDVFNVIYSTPDLTQNLDIHKIHAYIKEVEKATEKYFSNFEVDKTDFNLLMHDFRNFLITNSNPIFAFEPKAEDFSEYAEKVFAHILLLESMLNFEDFNYKITDITNVIQQIHPGINFNILITDSEIRPFTINGRTLFFLLNDFMAHNPKKYKDPASKSIEVSARSFLTEKGLLLEIVDNGCGMQFDQVFEVNTNPGNRVTDTSILGEGTATLKADELGVNYHFAQRPNGFKGTMLYLGIPFAKVA